MSCELCATTQAWLEVKSWEKTIPRHGRDGAQKAVFPSASPQFSFFIPLALLLPEVRQLMRDCAHKEIRSVFSYPHMFEDESVPGRLENGSRRRIPGD